MDKQSFDFKTEIKNNITALVNNNRLDAAKSLIGEYESIIKNDIEIYSIKAVTSIMEGRLEDAETILKEGLIIDDRSFDLLYNLAYVSAELKDYNQAHKYYKRALELCNEDSIKTEIKNAIDNIEKDHAGDIKEDKKKIAFFVKQGMDSFLGDIIDGLSPIYEVKKIVVTQYKQIDEGMAWADICWFEWCDELIIYGSKLEMAEHKKVVCRLHRYEVFSNYPTSVNWKNVDKLIIVTDHLKNLLSMLITDIEEKVDIVTVKNGVNLDKYKFNERHKGFNLAYVGYIHSRKNPVLLLQIISKLVKIDKRYKLYVAGQFQDSLIELYWNYQVKSMGLEHNVIFQGWQNNINKWLEDKQYILSASIHESFGYGIAEAMAMGIKPVIHNFVYANEIWDNHFLFNTIDEAVAMITSDDYCSKKYRSFIEDNYSLDKQLSSILEVLYNINSEDRIIELIKNILSGEHMVNETNIDDTTLLITNYNRGKMLKEDIESDYKFSNQNKLIVDDYSTSEREYVEYIKENHKNMNVVDVINNEDNVGLAEARNIGFASVNTKYTMILDDDDMLFCLNKEGLQKKALKLSGDAVIIIPRYILNLDENGDIAIGYDRMIYNNCRASDVLCSFVKSGEIRALFAGSISRTRDLLKCNTSSKFIVSEDYVTLTKLFANNLNKKVIVSEDYVHVRRINSNSLSKSISNKKLGLHLISHLISGYYCVKSNLMNLEQMLACIRQRASLIQKIYGFGEQFVNMEINYINGDLLEVGLLNYFNKIGIDHIESIEQLGSEISELKKRMNKNVIRQKLNFRQKNSSKVNIIIPAYNQKMYLKEAIESVLSQDYPNIEIIVADDCSTDGTDEMMRGYINSKKIKYIRNQINLGAGNNSYNALTNYADGEYVLVLNHDDYLIHDNYISMAVDILDSNPKLSFVWANSKVMNQDTGEVISTSHKIEKVINGVDYFINYATTSYPQINSVLTTIFRRKNALCMNCLNENSKSRDLFLHLKLMLTGDVYFINDHVGVYRKHRENISNKMPLEYDYPTIKELESLKDYVLQNFSVSKDTMENWINYRVYKYMFWRISTLINNNDTKAVQYLITLISNQYPKVCDTITKQFSISKVND